MSYPLNFRYDGHQMVPINPDACRRSYVPGHTYRLAEHEDRSRKSHRHYFACIHTAWQNLPEDQAARFPTSEHLRKHALIRCGFADQRTIVTKDSDNALVMISLVEAFDEFSICQVAGNIVTVWTAKSQSMRSMGKHKFDASKTAVLNYLASLIGVSVDDLTQGANQT